MFFDNMTDEVLLYEKNSNDVISELKKYVFLYKINQVKDTNLMIWSTQIIALVENHC